MAVTARSSLSLIAALFAFALVLPAFTEQSTPRAKLSDVATALSSGHASQAMDCFDKDAFPGYDKLSGFFESLTGAYQVDSQIDITDEEITDNAAAMNVHWILTLTDEGTNLDQRRDADIMVKLAKKKGAWRIVAFEPIDIFDPQMKH